VKAKEIEEEFRHFGKIVSLAKECVFSDGRLKGLHNGSFSIGLIPSQTIPGLLGFKGFKTRITYSGQIITCA
ncbi:Hypothetical protein FKW44_005890, partial [Caligus rogercresseyi]